MVLDNANVTACQPNDGVFTFTYNTFGGFSETTTFAATPPTGGSISFVPTTASADGTFRVRLQHQPGIKTDATGANDGDTDFDLTFVLNVE